MNDLERRQLDFINLRLGTFIHFNSASVQFENSELTDWEYGVENCGDKRRFPFDEKEWDPECLDTDEWAKIAKSAGCRFAALTTKHHEGFCLWNTGTTKHSIKNGSVKTDVVAKYLESFRKVGIKAGLYFSVLDLTEGVSRNIPFTAEKKNYILSQLRELLTNYGEIPFLMIDGWNSPWGGPSYKDLPFEEVSAFVRSIQPGCLVMNIGCSDDINGTDIIFYENAAGQEMDASFAGPGISCNKFTDTWFHRIDDPEKTLKSAQWAKSKAESYFKRNVNFMLNISPDKNGKVDENQKACFKELGSILTLPEALSELPEGWLKR